MTSVHARNVTFESTIEGEKKADEIERSQWWTPSDGRALEDVEKAKRGLLLLLGISRPMCTDGHRRIQTTFHPSRTMEMEKDYDPHIAFQCLPH